MAEQNTTRVAAEIRMRKPACSKEFHDNVDEEGSPITDAEKSETKLDGYADEERSRNVSAAECDDNVLSRPKRKREQPKLDDYEQNSPNNDCPVSEESTFRDHEIPLDELLDTLRKSTLTTQGSSTQSGPPPSVSHWSQPYNDNCIRKYFKMRRCVVGADKFIVRYLFGGNKKLHEIEKAQFATELYTIQDWLEKATSCINTSETELFLPSGCDPDKSAAYRRRFFLEVMEHRDQMESPGSPGLDGGNFAKKYSKFHKAYILRAVSVWMQKVADVVMLPPSDVDESTYEAVFHQYLAMFPLIIIGKGAKLGIPYRNAEVSSAPDLIIRRDRALSRFFGVVEVKKMTLDPTLKHAYEEPPKRGILNNTDEGLKPPKKRCVNFRVGASAASTNEESGEEDENQDASDLGGSPLTDSQRLFIKLFFGQLFGHVLALDCCPPTWYYPLGVSAFPQRLGIGVVGFRMY